MSILECYNTKIIPMRNGRGIAGAHIKYKRGDDGSDRVLCVTPQFISGQEYVISATNEDGRDDDETFSFLFLCMCFVFSFSIFIYLYLYILYLSYIVLCMCTHYNVNQIININIVVLL